MSEDLRQPTSAVTEPQIIEVKVGNSRVEISLAIPRELVYFHGHFPAFPILPGVVQIDWAVTYSKRYFNLGDGTARTLQIKFRQIIRPGDHLILTLIHQKSNSQIQFTYDNAEGISSSGRIGFESL
jgi:3-hydroxymyristoyl/3-hydroxydecanoyl-(acyl carrier protein) dehydratase